MRVKFLIPALFLSVFIVANPIISGIIPMVWEVPYTCATIKEAADMARRNDIILVYDCQTHYITETVSLDQDNVTLRAADGNYPEIIVNVQHPVNSQALLIARAFDGVDGVTIKDLYFTVLKGTTIWIGGYSRNTTVDNCDFSLQSSVNAGPAIYSIDPDGETRIENCTMWGQCNYSESVYIKYCAEELTMIDNNLYNRGSYIYCYNTDPNSDVDIGLYNNYYAYMYNNNSIYIVRNHLTNPGSGNTTIAGNIFHNFNNGIHINTTSSRINSWYNTFRYCSGYAHLMVGQGSFYKYGNRYRYCYD